MTVSNPQEGLKQEAKAKIAALARAFHEQISEYKLASYSEAQLRVDYLNEFLAILGWDVVNQAGLPPSFREVVTEDTVQVEGRAKSPDYSLRRRDGTRLIFIEAKKPHIDVSRHSDSSFQIRRYGWNADLPVSILTSFEYFAVYDCIYKPKRQDPARFARLKLIHYLDYEREFDYIWNHFSRQAVLDGSLKKFIGPKKLKKGTASVDRDFLESLDRWRMQLARDIHSLNDFDEQLLNSAVQQTIDRIIFLRIAEDRNIEPYGGLSIAVKGSAALEGLNELFRRADMKFNSGLFRHQVPLANLKISDSVLKKIIGGLYYPESPYEFSVLPIEILGKAYEQFLGKQITLTRAARIKIEEKPSVRKAGGVYYTPRYVVQHIVVKTLGALCEGKKPEEIAKLKIVDPASGSGSFLIYAYEYLLNWHKEYYNAAFASMPRNELRKVLTPTGELTTKFKGQLLLNNIYGVDIDANAVEVTKLSLLLKCLEGESHETVQAQRELFQERVLPTLDNNIRCGNSLIDFDIYTTSPDLSEDLRTSRRINAFNWKRAFTNAISSGGFDVVIGNPPYDVLEKDRKKKNTPHAELHGYLQTTKHYAPALGGKLNLFRVFLVKFLSLTRMDRKFGVIVPMALLADISCSKTRSHLFTCSKDLELDCFPQKDNRLKRIFFDAKLSTVILSGERSKISKSTDSNIVVKTYPENLFEHVPKTVTVNLADLDRIDPINRSVPITDAESWETCKKIYLQKNVSRLDSFQDEILVSRGEINQTTFKRFIKSKRTNCTQLIKGVQIGPYRFNQYLSQGKVEWFDEVSYLNSKKKKRKSKGAKSKKEKAPCSSAASLSRRIATQRISGVDERRRIVATIIESKAYFADSTNSIGLKPGASSYSLEYLLALLNSNLFQWRFKLTSTNNNVGTNELNGLPIRKLDPRNPKDAKQQKDLEECVEKILILNQRVSNSVKFKGESATLVKSASQSKRALMSADVQRVMDEVNFLQDKLNGLIYQLYNLTNDEVMVIERGMQN